MCFAACLPVLGPKMPGSGYIGRGKKAFLLPVCLCVCEPEHAYKVGPVKGGDAGFGDWQRILGGPRREACSRAWSDD